MSRLRIGRLWFLQPIKSNFIHFFFFLQGATNPPLYEDKERMRGDNDVIERKPGSRVKVECPPPALQAMGDRLLDWFSVIMADSKRRQTHTRTKGI